MRIALGILGVLLGLGTIAAGVMLWALANDFPETESTSKLVAAGMILVGLAFGAGGLAALTGSNRPRD